jgi:hypothetical protein
MKFFRAILMTVAILALATSTVAFADTITLDNANQSGLAGNTFTFTGTYTGNADNILQSGIHWTTASPLCDLGECLTGDGFLTLTGDQSGGISSFFDIFIDPSVGPGFYAGQYTLEDGDGNVLTSADFSVTVATPEPGSLALLGSGLLGLGGVIRRKLIA